MTTTYMYTKTDTSESLIVTGEVTKTIASVHPNFAKVRDYCFNTEPDQLDMEEVLKLVDAGQNIVKSLLRVTDRVSYKGTELLWDGEPIEGALASHIVRMIKEGDENYVAFAKFLENLSQNPSKASRDALFDWIADRNFTITSEGYFVGYKGVNHNRTSWHAGYGIVDGVEMTCNLPNEIGSVVEVPRNKVDESRDSACSYGLHIGTRGYAQSYGSRMIIVGVNPRDVVMVPRDGGGQKMRVCKYVVLDDNAAELNTTTYASKARVDDTPSDIFDANEECEECGCDLNGETCGALCCDDYSADEIPEEPFGVCRDCGDEVDAGDDQCEECEEDEAAEKEECEFCGAELDDEGECPNV